MGLKLLPRWWYIAIWLQRAFIVCLQLLAPALMKTLRLRASYHIWRGIAVSWLASKEFWIVLIHSL